MVVDDEQRREIDWEVVGDALGVIQRTDGGWSGSGGNRVAQRALAHVLGAEVIESTALQAIDRGPGSEVARSVLGLLEPIAAMEVCWRVYLTSDDEDERHDAIVALQSFCTAHALPWLDEVFARGTHRGARYWACMGVARIAERAELLAEDVDAWIARIAADPDPLVALAAKNVRDWGSPDGAHRVDELERALARLLLDEWAPTTGETGVGAEMESDICAFLLAEMLRPDHRANVDQIAARLRAYRGQAMASPRPPDDEADARVARRVIDLAT